MVKRRRMKVLLADMELWEGSELGGLAPFPSGSIRCRNKKRHQSLDTLAMLDFMSITCCIIFSLYDIYDADALSYAS